MYGLRKAPWVCGGCFMYISGTPAVYLSATDLDLESSMIIDQTFVVDISKENEWVMLPNGDNNHNMMSSCSNYLTMHK